MKTGLGGSLARLALLLVTLPATCLPVVADPVFVKQLVPPIVDDPFGYAKAVTTDPQMGEIFVCDSRKSRVVIFDREGLFQYEIDGGGTFSSPADVAVDRHGYIFLLANHKGRQTLLVLDFDGLFLREIVPAGLPEEIVEPLLSSVAVTPAGDRVYLVDEANHVLWITGRDGRLQGSVDFAAGLSEKERRDVTVGQVDVFGERVLVALPSFGEIRLFDRDGNSAGRIGKKGTAPCELGFPTAAALDGEGNLVIVDQQRMVILRWSVESDRCLGEYYGIGNAPGYLYYPLDLALDGTGRIYVTQGFEGRVQAYEGLPPAPGLPPFDGPDPEQWVTRQARLAREEEAPPTPAEIAAARAAEARHAAEESVRAWTRARVTRHVEDYLSLYSRRFVPPGGLKRKRWETLQRARSEGARWNDFGISELEIEIVEFDVALATFVAARLSNPQKDRTRTSLILVQEDEGWRITEERNDPF